MKTNYTTILMLLLATTFSFAQQTVLLDLGDFNSDAWFADVNTYNNVTDAGVSGVYNAHAGSHGIADMINDAGTNTGFTFAITQDFQYFGGNGNVTANPMTGAAASFDSNAVRDYFFTSENDGNPVAQISFSGLDDTKFYAFEIFASRKTNGSNRNSQYTIAGATTEVVTLRPDSFGGSDAEGNTSNTVIANAVQPSAGVITLTLEKASDNTSSWAYLNCLKMEETDTATVENQALSTEGLDVYPNPVADVLNIDYKLNETGAVKLSITDITGRIIHTENTAENQVGTYSLKWNRNNVAAGIYFLQLQSGTSKISKKVVLK